MKAIDDFRIEPIEWPESTATEAEWRHFRGRASEIFVQKIKEIDKVRSGDSLERLADLRALRHEHNLLVVGDRIRRGAVERGQAPPADLRREAGMLLEKILIVDEGSGPIVRTRTEEEQRYLGSARVQWHKLIRRAQARPAVQRVPQRRRPSNSQPAIAKDLRELINESVSREADRILRHYVAERIEQIMLDSDTMTQIDHRYLSADTRRILRKLRALLDHIRQQGSL